MRCPNCSAECADQSTECDFCGQPFTQNTTASVTDAPQEHVQQEVPAAVVPPVYVSNPVPPPNPYQNTSHAPVPQAAVPNHMTWAIISTVVGAITNLLGCCCFPVSIGTGIAAIFFASKVNKLLEGGDIDGARAAEKTAKLWCWITTVLAIIFGVLFIVSFVLQMMGYTDPNYLENLRKQLEAGR